jgi:predicted DNA-binding transcriptional regulator YafY
MLLTMGRSDFQGDAAMVRLFSRLLTGQVLTAKAIAKELGINDAASRKKLGLLLRLPCAVEERNGRQRAVKFTTLLPRDAISGMDVAAACLVSSFGSALRETALAAPARRFVERFVTGSRSYRDAKDLDRKFWFVVRGGEPALSRNHNGLMEVIEALLQSNRIHFAYEHSDGQRQALRLRPVTLAVHDHQLYVICWLDDVPKGTHGFYPYRFSRMSDITAGASFAYPAPAAYNPAVLFRNTFGIFIALNQEIEHVRIRLNDFWGRYAVNHRWHESQEWTAESDGSVVITMNVRICIELKRWVLWFGEDVEVLEPAHLRDWVAAEHEKASATYDQLKPGVKSAKQRGTQPRKARVASSRQTKSRRSR